MKLGRKTHPVDKSEIKGELAHFRHDTRTNCDPGCYLPQHNNFIFHIDLPVIEDGKHMTHNACNAGTGAGQCAIHTAWPAPARAASHPSAAIPAKRRSPSADPSGAQAAPTQLELRGNKRVRGERKPMLTNFKVLGHWLTFQVRSMTQISEK